MIKLKLNSHQLRALERFNDACKSRWTVASDQFGKTVIANTGINEMNKNNPKTSPEGAIDFETVFRHTQNNQVLYQVHDMGSETRMQNIIPLKLVVTTSDFVQLHFCFFDNLNTLSPKMSTLCLGDFNIGAHHNDHYLFKYEHLAMRYIEEIKSNIQE